jgi:hypothetical protein
MTQPFLIIMVILVLSCVIGLALFKWKIDQRFKRGMVELEYIELQLRLALVERLKNIKDDK